jgi:hypothetical protein
MQGVTALSRTLGGAARAELGAAVAGLCTRHRVQPDAGKSDHADRNRHGDGCDGGRFERTRDQPELAGL